MKRIILTLLFIFTLVSTVYAQPVNPTRLSFDSVDHNNPEVTGYEIDILDATGAVLSTSVILKASTTIDPATGEIIVNVSVQPVAFGTGYTFVARTTTAVVNSANSLPTEVWNRAPIEPSNLTPS